MANKTAILGAGAMGTACAILLSENEGHSTSVVALDQEMADRLNADRENKLLLPNVPIPPQVSFTADVAEAVDGADLFVVAIPTEFLREALEGYAPHLNASRPAVSVVKGMEAKTLLRPSQIITEVLGGRSVCSLCGPSHAEEIARRLPASVVAASGDLSLSRKVQQLFSTDRFRVYTNLDLVGVELAGALKNVIAIAAGICDGLEFGDNAKSALLTRGTVEMARFGEAMGAEPETFAGLAGIGDLMTTCFSRHSRNRLVGERLGRGETIEQIREDMVAVAEGVNTTRSVYQLAIERDIEMPITTEVYNVLYQGKSPLEVTTALMSRPPRSE